MNIKSIITSFQKYAFPCGEFSSQSYWASRYRSGGNSGPGSYGPLAEFKASILNEFIHSSGIKSIIEFGSGDGNQLKIAKYPAYTGYDVSPSAVKICRQLFKNDPTKTFFLASEYDGRKADLSMSLDVIFHLTEDHIFENYMRTLFDAANSFVVIYSSNQDDPIEPLSVHVRHRQFTKWIENHFSSKWSLARKIPNAYPYNGDYKSTSFSDFYIYRKK